MAGLTGTNISDTYKDVVQLEQSGSGLPSHGGAPAALYDGDGNLVNAHLGVHAFGLDPDPISSAQSDTLEPMVERSMTQGELESAGWTFVSCSAEVSGGILWVKPSAQNFYAYLTVSLDDDFVYHLCPFTCYRGATTLPMSATTLPDGRSPGLFVADTVGDVYHSMEIVFIGLYARINENINGTFSTLTKGTTGADSYGDVQGGGLVSLTLQRFNGTVYLSKTMTASPIFRANISANNEIYMDTNAGLVSNAASVADSSTFNRVGLIGQGAYYGGKEVYGFLFFRRYV